MKKILSAAAVSALLLSAGIVFAGSPQAVQSKRGCPGDCQDQINSLQSSQDRQDEQINANTSNILQNKAEIDALKAGDYNPWYVKATLRTAWVGSMDLDMYGFKADTDTGYGGGFSVGRQFGQLRIEGELASQKSDLKVINSGDVRIDTAMINGFYDVPVYGALSVYGTAGIGAGKVEMSIEQIDDSETTFAYKAGMGVAYAFASNMAVDLGYEYMRTSDVELGRELLRVDDLKTSSVSAAFRYSF